MNPPGDALQAPGESGSLSGQELAAPPLGVQSNALTQGVPMGHNAQQLQQLQLQQSQLQSAQLMNAGQYVSAANAYSQAPGGGQGLPLMQAAPGMTVSEANAAALSQQQLGQMNPSALSNAILQSQAQQQALAAQSAPGSFLAQANGFAGMGGQQASQPSDGSGNNQNAILQQMMIQQLIAQQAQQSSALLLQQQQLMGAGIHNSQQQLQQLPQFASSVAMGLQQYSPLQQASQQIMAGQPQGRLGQVGMVGLDSQQAAAYKLAATLQAPGGKGKKRGRGKNKRDKNRPKQPLSAYNIFFKEERAKMIAELEKEESEKAEEEKEEGKEGEAKAEDGDGDDGGGEPQPKKKKGSKIGFEKLAKTIAAKWKAITKTELTRFEALAQEDQKRYKTQLAEYLEKKKDDPLSDSSQ